MNHFPAHALNKRLILAWMLGIIPSYFMLGFLDRYYTSFIGFGLAAFLFHIPAALFVYYLFGRLRRDFQTRPFETGIAIALFAALSLFGWSLLDGANQFPRLFEARTFLIQENRLLPFAVGVILSFAASAWMMTAFGKRIRKSRLAQFLDANLGGLLLGLIFFSIYFLIAYIINQPVFNSDDIFFDADSRLWRWRFATENYRDYYWRPVHPFALIVIRPLVGLISILFKGDTLVAAFALVAGTGALCVFLVWHFMKRAVGSSTYALLIASMLGASSAHLVFGSLIETYIFLAAVALIFIVLLLENKPLHALVITGLVAFGITISNFGQTVIAHLMVRRSIRQLIVYGLIVAALVVPLTLLNNFVYPDSQPYFFDPSTYEGEGHNSFPPTLQRAHFLGRVMFLHGMVAPQPLIYEEEIPFLKVWMFRAAIKKEPMRLARYETWFDTSLAYAWLGLLLLGGMMFLKNLRRDDNRFSLTFILTILFNFALHMQYGKDVFLYSVNWTYAVLLFLGLAWRDFAGKRWFQILLLIFIALLLANNLQLILTMLSASALRIK